MGVAIWGMITPWSYIGFWNSLERISGLPSLSMEKFAMRWSWHIKLPSDPVSKLIAMNNSTFSRNNPTQLTTHTATSFDDWLLILKGSTTRQTHLEISWNGGIPNHSRYSSKILHYKSTISGNHRKSQIPSAPYHFCTSTEHTALSELSQNLDVRIASYPSQRTTTKLNPQILISQ